MEKTSCFWEEFSSTLVKAFVCTDCCLDFCTFDFFMEFNCVVCAVDSPIAFGVECG